MNALTSTKDILFVTGFPRSGTTWTNRIFQHCFKCGFANEIQFLLKFNKRLASYGDLSSEGNMDRLVYDLLNDDYFKILKKTRKIEISKAELMNRMERASFPDLVYAVLSSVSLHLGKEVVGGKCPSLGWDLDTIYSLFPNAKVVHVMRDGRDCALSHYRMSWGFRNAYMAASNWVDYVQRARATGRHVGPGQYLEFRYEDLLSDPAGVLTRLELFILGRADANVHACALDEVGGNGILDNVNKWKSMMTPKEQGVFETVAGNVLTELGYESSVQEYKVSWFEASYWWLEHQIRKETRMVMRKFFPSMSEKIKVN